MAEETKKESSEKEVKIPKKFEDIVEKIEKMSVLDLSELVKILEEKFGVSASAPVAIAAAAPVETEDKAEEKSSFTVELKETGEKKIDAIKVVRDVTGKGLAESKALVDAVASGAQVLKENAKKEEAEEIKKKFEAIGAKVELK